MPAQSNSKPRNLCCRNLCCWGLYCGLTRQAVPLKSLNVSAQVINNIARVFFTQVYYNQSNTLLETEFFFPIASDICLDSFEAKYNNITVKGLVKPKDIAKEEYKEAKSKGHIAAYSEVVEEAGDIMKVMLCNIPPETDVSITYSHIEKLDMVLDKFWCFRLFSTLTPRYNKDTHSMLNRNVDMLSNYPTINPNDNGAYPWKVEVDIQTSSPLKFLKSSSHPIITKYGNEKHTCTITLDPSLIHKPNKDLVIMYSTEDENKIGYMLTPFEEGYCAMINVAADFNEDSDEKVYAKIEQAKETANFEEEVVLDMKSVRGEYIFLIDRSGSMDGDRITMASTALQLFIKSLPMDSYFNVVSFGSTYKFLNEESVKSHPSTLNKTITSIKSFKANLGGTEIREPLQKVFSQPIKKGYPRFVFLLTDGAVSNTQSVLDLIKANSSTSQVFTIGIGNGCSPELITKGAQYGRGKYEFVSNNADIYDKVVGLLNASLSPLYSEFSIQASNFDAIVKNISPNPATVQYLLKGQQVTFYLFLRKEAFDDKNEELKLTVKMHDSRTQEPRAVKLILKASQSIQNDMIAKLAIHDMITRLEEQEKDTSKATTTPWFYKGECENELIELSLKYGILTSQTAFICEISDNSEINNMLTHKKIIVPTVISCDYASQDHLITPVYGAPPSGGGMKRCMLRSPGNPFQQRFNEKESSSDTSFLQSVASGVSNFVGSFAPSSGKIPKFSAPMKNSVDHVKSFVPKKEEMTLVRKSLKTAPNNNSQSLQDNTQRMPTLGVACSPNIHQNIPTSVSEVRRKEKEAKICSLQADFSQKVNKPQKSATSLDKESNKASKLSYIDILMQQNYEGSWNANDVNIKKNVLNGKIVPSVPAEIQNIAGKQAQAVWVTVLVLIWLEVVFINERKAWALVHQKGRDWLKENGVEYEKVKELGKVALKY